MSAGQSIADIIREIVAREGGFADHKADRGGPTKFGITQKTLSAYLGRKATREDVRALKAEQAVEIYLRNYVAAPRFEALPASIAPFVIDTGVHSGPRASALMLQRVLNQAGFGPLDLDGIAGPATRRAASRADGAMGDFLLFALIVERLNFIERLIAADPSQKAFERGWKARINAFWPASIEREKADASSRSSPAREAAQRKGSEG